MNKEDTMRKFAEALESILNMRASDGCEDYFKVTADGNHNSVTVMKNGHSPVFTVATGIGSNGALFADELARTMRSIAGMDFSQREFEFSQASAGDGIVRVVPEGIAAYRVHIIQGKNATCREAA